MVGVAAEVYVCSRLARDTGGTYGVALSESHLEELMMRHAPPPAATAEQAGAELVSGKLPWCARCEAVSAHLHAVQCKPHFIEMLSSSQVSGIASCHKWPLSLSSVQACTATSRWL